MRRLHGSGTFWLGLFVLAFLVTEWVDSRHHQSAVSWNNGSVVIALTNAQTGISLSQCRYQPGVFAAWGIPAGFSAERYPEAPPARVIGQAAPDAVSLLFPAAMTFRVRPETSDMTTPPTRGALIAHWFLIALFVALWLDLLYWRHRRIRRIPPPGLPPQP